MSSTNCCSLTCIQISQEAGQVVWYSHIFQNFPQFIVIHRVKGFGIVKKTEIDVSLELSYFFIRVPVPTREHGNEGRAWGRGELPGTIKSVPTLFFFWRRCTACHTVTLH